jgi:hypothetical protein
MGTPLESVLDYLCVLLAHLVLRIERVFLQKLTAMLNTFTVSVISIILDALFMLVHCQT